MSQQEFILEINQLGITLTKHQEEQLEMYYQLLVHYNQHMNLTGITEKDMVYLKHFYDSLTLVKIANLTQGKLLDVGTGAGFPGLVLAIAFPKLDVTLLDSNNKKIAFLKECTQKLQLSNVTIIYDRAENYTRLHREEFDFVTSRAVAELRILLELNIPALKINGKFLVMKANIEEELKQALKTIEILNCKIINRETFDLPKNGGKRTLLVICKERKTIEKYPRTFDKIKKHPIK